MQSGCHAQWHDIRGTLHSCTLYQTITLHSGIPLNKMTSIPIHLWAQHLFSEFYLMISPTSKGVHHSSAGTATFYRLAGPGFEASGGAIFQTHPEWAQGPPSRLYNGYQVTFPGVKRHHLTPSSTRSSRAVPLLPLCASLACHATAFSFFTN